VLAGAAILAGLGFAAGAAIVRLDHLQLEPVLSGSMRPGIQPGDLAVLRPVAIGRLHVGEVIAYLPPGHAVPVMHRIVSIDARGLVTKGDANRTADPWGRVRAQGATVERLVAVVPALGWLTGFRRQLLIVAGSVLLLALATALRTRKDNGPPPDHDVGRGAEEHVVRQIALLAEEKEQRQS
jgi:signal peptidase I